jgi:hypothetical protein|tara:strand:- start:98 stop:202 length:105 start_codon:yes stop_codon:yes gene_type:complete
MDFLKEFWEFLIIFGGLIILTQGSPVAPFIYAIF